MSDIGRLLTAMVTPFEINGEVDYPQAKNLAGALLDSGSDGVVVSGTTGESPTLSRDEKLRLFAAVKAAVGDHGAVIAGTGSNDTRASIELTQAAETTGVDAVLLVVPYYNKPTPDGLYRHFEAISRNTNLPCILYNVPSRTVTNLTTETVARLSKLPNLIGIKESSGDIDQIAAIIDVVPSEEFRVWSGNDHDTIEVMRRGGYGLVSIASHLVGLEIKELIELCIDRKQSEAQASHDRLMPLFRDLFVLSNPIPVKYLLNHIGFEVGGYRLPLTAPDEKTRTLLEETLKQYTINLPLSKEVSANDL